MTETKQTSTTKTDRRPDCVTEIRMGNSVLTVSGGKYEEYDDTNRFYLSLGFQEFEVFPTLWDAWNPCQIYIMTI